MDAAGLPCMIQLHDHRLAAATCTKLATVIYAPT